jgi:hypothetical protein
MLKNQLEALIKTYGWQALRDTLLLIVVEKQISGVILFGKFSKYARKMEKAVGKLKQLPSNIDF